MSRIDRHVLSECLQTLGLTLGVIVGLLLLQDVYNELKHLLEDGAGLRDVIRYYLVLTPSFLPAVIPISFMVSILFGLGQLHRNSEVTAMQAAGMSLFRITRSIWVMGVVLALLMFYLNAEVVPWSVEQSRNIRENQEFAAELKEKAPEEVGIINSLTYFNHTENRLWFMNRFSEFNYSAYGVTVSQLDSRQREESRIVANQGYFDDFDGYWVLENGRKITFDPLTGDAIRSLPFSRETFEHLTDDPVLMKFREKRPKDLSFNELSRVLASISHEHDPDALAYLVRYYSVAATPVICLLVVGLAVPYAVSGVRVNPMVGVSKAIGLFLAYYVIVSIASLLGSQGKLAPILAAWLPSICGAVAAVWLNYRRRFS